MERNSIISLCRDIEEIALLEKRACPEPRSVEDLKKDYVQDRESWMWVLRDKKTDVCIGYYAVHLQRTHTRILRVVIDPEFRRQGHGSYLISHAKEKIQARCETVGRRIFLDSVVNERDVVFQKFLNAQQFKAVHISRGFFETDDAIMFNWWPNETIPQFRGRNRISKYSNQADSV